jgi:hypothetical protein
MEQRKSCTHRNFYITIILCIILSAPVYFFRITKPVDSDYGGHVASAEYFLDNGYFEPAAATHPILKLLMIVITKTTGGFLGLYASLFLLQIVAQGMIGGIVYYWIGSQPDRKLESWRIFASVSVTFIAPFMIYALKDGLFYYGYIGMANYHNPTIHLLKPIALGGLILAEKGLNHPKNNTRTIILSAILVVISAGIKPNFVMSFIPALGLVCLCLLLSKKEFDIKMNILGFAVPSILVLSLQYMILYGNESANIKIIWAPFVVGLAFSSHLFLKFLLSSLFVIQGLLVFWRSLISDRILFLGWVMFLIGIFQNYFLAESGSATMHGNFGWSGQIVLFLLTVIILRKSFQTLAKQNSNDIKAIIPGLLTYLLQLVGGIAYYFYCLTSVHYR